MPEARQTQVCAIPKLKLIVLSHLAIRLPEGDPTQKDKTEANDPLPLQGSCCCGGPFSPTHQGSRAGHRAHQDRHTRSLRLWQSRGGCSLHYSHHRHWSLGAKWVCVWSGIDLVSQFDTFLKGEAPWLPHSKGQ